MLFIIGSHSYVHADLIVVQKKLDEVLLSGE